LRPVFTCPFCGDDLEAIIELGEMKWDGDRCEVPVRLDDSSQASLREHMSLHVLKVPHAEPRT
jgi:hypothetical protein